MNPDLKIINDKIGRLFEGLLDMGDLTIPLDSKVKALMKRQLDASEAQRGGDYYKTREALEEENYLSPILCALTRDQRRIMNQQHHFDNQRVAEDEREFEKIKPKLK